MISFLSQAAVWPCGYHDQSFVWEIICIVPGCVWVCVVHHIYINKYTFSTDIQFSDIYFMKWPIDHVSEQGFQWITAALKSGIEAERQSITGPKKKRKKNKHTKLKKLQCLVKINCQFNNHTIKPANTMNYTKKKKIHNKK